MRRWFRMASCTATQTAPADLSDRQVYQRGHHSASLQARRCTTRTSPLKFSARHADEGSSPRGGIRLRTTVRHLPQQIRLQARGRAARHPHVRVGPFLAVLAFLLLRKLCERPCGQPPGTHQARCRSRAHQWTVRSQQGFVARGFEGKNRHTPGRGQSGWAK
jgi:hypothetical protein